MHSIGQAKGREVGPKGTWLDLSSLAMHPNSPEEATVGGHDETSKRSMRCLCPCPRRVDPFFVLARVISWPLECRLTPIQDELLYRDER